MMNGQTQLAAFECPTDEIAAYIDGELDPLFERELEAHLATCELCVRELNEQKQFLCGLNASLKHEAEMDLPANFTKLVVANAESSVSGLRRPRERYNAVFICAGLFLFGLFALGTDAGKIYEGIAGAFDQIGAVGGFFGRIVYSVFLGISIILRSFAAQLRLDAAMAILLPAVVAGLLMYLSRKALRINRA